MKNDASVSVVIPHYDDETRLDRCLEALSRQDGPGPLEIIVVDNASPRPPRGVCAAHPRTRLVVEPRPGPGHARTTGARLAKGSIVAFLDSDCYPAPDWTSVVAGTFAASPQTDVIGGDIRIAPRDAAGMDAIEGFEALFAYRQELFVERDGYTATCNMAVRRHVFDAVGAFGGIDIAEDMDWGRRATAAGFTIRYVPAMRVATPARESFAEVARKLERQTGHDFQRVISTSDKIRWAAKALAMPLSPLADVPRILRSERIAGARLRAATLVFLARTRLWRGLRMLSLLVNADRARGKHVWRDTATDRA